MLNGIYPENVVAYITRCTCRGFCPSPCAHDPECDINTCVEPDPRNPSTHVGWMEIRRTGTPKREGGEGVQWWCSCGQTKNGLKCEHLKALYRGPKPPARHAYNVHGVTENIEEATIDMFLVRLTPLGVELFHPKWCIELLKHIGSGSSE